MKTAVVVDALRTAGAKALPEKGYYRNMPAEDLSAVP